MPHAHNSFTPIPTKIKTMLQTLRAPRVRWKTRLLLENDSVAGFFFIDPPYANEEKKEVVQFKGVKMKREGEKEERERDRKRKDAEEE